MFKLKSSLREGEPGQSGDGGAPTQQPNTPPVNLQAQIDAAVNAALAKQQADFAAQLEQATGHKDIKALTEANLKAQGKLQELADAKAAEAQSFKVKYEQLAIEEELMREREEEQLAISNALLTAANEAVDPATVVDLLSSKAKVDDAGNVTIEGKPAAEAVKGLLESKPFLAKAQGGTGSGAPANAGTAAKNPWSADHWNLTEQVMLQKTNPTLAAQLKAAASH